MWAFPSTFHVLPLEERSGGAFKLMSRQTNKVGLVRRGGRKWNKTKFFLVKNYLIFIHFSSNRLPAWEYGMIRHSSGLSAGWWWVYCRFRKPVCLIILFLYRKPEVLTGTFNKKNPCLQPKNHSNTLVWALKQNLLSKSPQNNRVKVIQMLTIYSKKMKSAEVRLGGVKT